MPTNHDETLQERYAREASDSLAMREAARQKNIEMESRIWNWNLVTLVAESLEPKTPMVRVMAANWQEDSLPPTWEQIQTAVREHDALERRVAELEKDLAETNEMNAQLREQNDSMGLACAEMEQRLSSAPAAQPEPVAWLVCSVNKDGSYSLEYAAPWREAAHEHINDAVVADIDGASTWVVRPAYIKEQSVAGELESALEALVNRCNKDAGLANDDAVVSAEAVLEGLYRSRVKQIRSQSNG